jgi:hypothetical protein
VYPNDERNIDREKQLADQADTIKKVTNWFKEEGLDPQEITHLRQDARYYGVIISDQPENAEQNEKPRRKAFHILFPSDRLDSVTISEIIIFDLLTQKAYLSLSDKRKGILEQDRFYSELKLALLQMNVRFQIKKGIRDLQSLEAYEVLFFDGLTKNSLFHTIDRVHNSIEIARIKSTILRDLIFPPESTVPDERVNQG